MPCRLRLGEDCWGTCGVGLLVGVNEVGASVKARIKGHGGDAERMRYPCKQAALAPDAVQMRKLPNTFNDSGSGK
jgi:hypothetical protein